MRDKSWRRWPQKYRIGFHAAFARGSYPPDRAFEGCGQAYVGSSRVDLQACKLEYSIVSPK